MAERVSRLPKSNRARMLETDVANRFKRRKIAIETLRRQSEIATERLAYDIFNVWRTGEGTMQAIAEACGYSVNWVSSLIHRIKNDEALLERAINQWMDENPGAELK
jgi:hypothetical protein